MVSKKALVSAVSALGVLIGMQDTAAAQDAQTFTSAFNVPVFNSIDENGVDLVTGVWRVRTPTISVGEGLEGQQQGLEWTGSSWRHIGSPSIWRNGSKYIVQFMGQSHEFNDRSSGYSQRAPIDGSSLTCSVEAPGNAMNWCTFISRDGDVVFFRGVLSTLPGLLQYYGLSALRFGNLGVSQINVSYAAKGNPPINVFSNTGGGVISNPNPSFPGGGTLFISGGDQYGAYCGGVFCLADFLYREREYVTGLAGRRIRINTPNHSDDSDEHYLRPRDTTQTVTDDFGNSWQYTFVDGSDRELTRVVRPGGLGTLVANYNGDERVQTITTPAGVWSYSYTSSGGFGTTTVTNPQNETTFIRYNREYGYVTEVRDALNRTTRYTWNATTRRLEQIQYPEGNRTTFQYDARGNVTRRTDFSKSGTESLVSQAGGFPECTVSNRANCNKPRWVIDPNGNRTDFEYTGNIHAPTRIIRPAPTPGAARPTIVTEYSGGLPTRTSICPTQATCAGSSDEIVTEYEYRSIGVGGGLASGADQSLTFYRVVARETVTTGGVSRTVCHRYDSLGRRISSTPPLANVTGCGTAETVEPLAANANPPEATPKTLPSFPGVAGGGGGTGGGGVEDPPFEDPCLQPGSQVQCQ
jgi:YD repeat-containing protein